MEIDLGGMTNWENPKPRDLYNKKIPLTCKIQRWLCKLGIAVHNPFRDECCEDFSCCSKKTPENKKYWLRIPRLGHKKHNEIIGYADTYSHEVWVELMRRYRELPNYTIGANDVSDIVMNSIINALNGMRFPKDFRKI